MIPEVLNIDGGKTVKDDLEAAISKGDKLSIAAACFSMYAYQVLKEQLDGIAELRFIFTSPTFLKEEAVPKDKREFYIPRLGRERSLYGTEFEVKLRNELTQKAIARECADWIRKKVQFRSNVTGGNISQFAMVGQDGRWFVVTEDPRGGNLVMLHDRDFAVWGGSGSYGSFAFSVRCLKND